MIARKFHWPHVLRPLAATAMLALTVAQADPPAIDVATAAEEVFCADVSRSEVLYFGGGPDLPLLIYSNSGSLSDPFMLTRTGGQCGFAGGAATDLQTTLGLSVYGWACQLTSTGSINAVADDFVVPPGECWAIDGIKFFVYQTGAPVPSIGNFRYAICAGSWLGSTPPAVWNFGPTTVDFPTIFKKRDIDGPPDGCGRRIQGVTVSISPPVALPPGPYGLAWYAVGNPSYAGPWQPPVVIPGFPGKPGATGLQSLGGAAFAPISDSGVPQDFVFQLTGTIAGPAPGAGDGDLNCDGLVNAFDIGPFVLALTDPAGYAAAYPCCTIWNADVNDDGLINAFDIGPFVTCLTGGGC